jgi:hypothetical protein
MMRIFTAWLIALLVLKLCLTNFALLPTRTRSTQSPVLLFITTHLSSGHVLFLEYCWPLVLKRSKLIRSADVLLFATGPCRLACQRVLRVFDDMNVHIVNYANPGYQDGAILAMDEALKHKWFHGYDWVVRVNADVIVRDDTWLLETMSKIEVEGIFVDCDATPCTAKQACANAQIQTDFFVFRPSAIQGNLADLPATRHAERKATALFQPIIRRGSDRWLPGTEFQGGYCRVAGQASPVIHDHAYLATCLQEAL